MGNTAAAMEMVVREIQPPEGSAELRSLREVAFLYAAGKSVPQISEELDITRRHVRERLSHPAFDTVLHQQGAAMQAASDRRQAYLGRVVDAAIGVFEDALEHKNPAVRMKAAGELLDREGTMVKQRRQLKATVQVTMTAADLAKLKARALDAYMPSLKDVTAEVVDEEVEARR